MPRHGESLVGGIDVKMTLTEVECQYNRAAQHSLFVTQEISRVDINTVTKCKNLIYAFLMLQGSVGIPFFFGSFPLLKFSLHWVLLYQKSTESSTHKSVDLA